MLFVESKKKNMSKKVKVEEFTSVATHGFNKQKKNVAYAGAVLAEIREQASCTITGRWSVVSKKKRLTKSVTLTRVLYFFNI